MEEAINKALMESKAVIINGQLDGTVFPALMTAFDGNDHPAFERAGYRGRYVMFTLMDGGVQQSFTDPFKMELGITSKTVRDALISIRRGWRTKGREGVDWSDIEDGGVYDAESLADK